MSEEIATGDLQAGVSASADVDDGQGDGKLSLENYHIGHILMLSLLQNVSVKVKPSKPDPLMTRQKVELRPYAMYSIQGSLVFIQGANAD